MTPETAEATMKDETPGVNKSPPLGFLPYLKALVLRLGRSRKLVYLLIIGAALSGVVTYGALTGLTQIGGDPTAVLILFIVNLVFLLLLGIVVMRQIVAIWVARRRGSAGSRLHIRLVVIFGLVAVTPAIVVAVFSVLFFNLGIQAWFSDQVRTALDESNAVAQAYLKEHHQNLRVDILAVAADVSREGRFIFTNPNLLNEVIAAQAALRSLSEIIVFEGSGKVLGKAGTSFVLEFESAPPEWTFNTANEGKVALFTTDSGDRVRALVKLDRFDNTYLYIGRFVDSRVLNHMESTQRAVQAYEQLEGRRSGLQVTFAMVFIIVALLLLLVSVWIGLVFANNLVRPVSQMIDAAEKVRIGDLTARVDESNNDDELGSLSRAFNRMTSQLDSQRGELVEANRQLELRNRFTEAVLAGVSAGVIGLDDDGRINLPNRPASDLLDRSLESFIGQPIAEVFPEVCDLISQAKARPERLAESHIKLTRSGRQVTLLVRVAAEELGKKVLGYVVTFDDISDLLSAQRKAAWADVARRIAHEIKNPLTPIQLSAERLKRKYLKEIKTDPDTFATYTDTIVRQVGDIGRMVDEFSAFARMPQPVIERMDVVRLIKDSLFLPKNTYPDIAFTFDSPDHVEINCDGQLIGQVLTNIFKNAAEAIEGREGKKSDLPPGEIKTRVMIEDGGVVIEVADNGCGLPAEERDKLTEPYVTTRKKGTGLGLAIVKKIVEDHQGSLTLEDNDGGGAKVRLVLPLEGA